MRKTLVVVLVMRFLPLQRVYMKRKESGKKHENYETVI